MNWTTQVVIMFICLNSMVWYGMECLPPDVRASYDWGEHSDTVSGVVGTWFNTADDDPTEFGWGDPKDDEFSMDILTNPTDIFQIPASVLGGFLGGFGKAFSYILGFLDGVSSWFGATYIILVAMGIPQPWAGIVSMAWVMLLAFTLISLITGREV